jgi:acetyl-CoA carboxylase carboxyltransferase component/biotin carboxylase
LNHPSRLLIANRGEIALRIARTARESGIESVAIHAAEEPVPAHSTLASSVIRLPHSGPSAYLDQDSLVGIALQTGCTLVHPGYGFLSENAGFAARCRDAGLCFVGPPPDALALLGHKSSAKTLAKTLEIPVIEDCLAASPDALQMFLDTLDEDAEALLKAVAGGGGRGMRIVRQGDDVAALWESCRREAHAAFGSGELYAERYLRRVRHIEIQVACDALGFAKSLGDRDCTLQRQYQKVVEMAPAAGLDGALLAQLTDAAERLVSAAGCTGLATVEFLLPCDNPADYRFIEVNPRLQVEHTITEQLIGLDLVALQLRLAQGHSLQECGLMQIPPPRGFALQCRINAEEEQSGRRMASHGRVQTLAFPGGPGIRIDTALRAGDEISGLYDSLVAKLVIHGDDLQVSLGRATRALQETRIEGVATNLDTLTGLFTLLRPGNMARLDTSFLSDPGHFSGNVSVRYESAPSTITAGDQLVDIVAPVTGLLSRWEVAEGAAFPAGATVAYLNSMKMDIAVTATQAGILRQCVAAVGQLVTAGSSLGTIAPTSETLLGNEAANHGIDPDYINPALAESLDRHARTRDGARPAAVERRRKTGQRTARENVDNLLDPGSFIEYGALALAGQRRRRSLQQLIDQSPADGLIAGIGTVNAAVAGEDNARCMVLAYDYTVFAGTQGLVNHKKADRMLHLAERWKLPVVLFAEGGGGRPGDTDFTGVSALDSPTFKDLAKLSALVPLIGIVSGRCFAGNAALLGCCDVIIATRNASIGMAGPAMIEGGGLGRFRPEEVGPSPVQFANGVIDILVEDEAEAVAMAKRYLACFQGQVPTWTCRDQRLLRQIIPENRRLAFDVRHVIETLADEASFIELRKGFAKGMITGFVRIEGVCFGLIANDCREQGGAIDAACGDKASRFLQLCDAFDIPVISFCDTPGFMVGPDAEKHATVRHVSRMFVTAANLDIPVFTVVLRKGYGLGAQAMAAGSFHASFFTVSWPSGEFGAMGLEGAVRLGYSRELAAITPPEKREKFFRRLVRKAYEQGKAINVASHLEIDDVIDPAETRNWIMAGWRSVPRAERRDRKKRAFIDTW